MLSPDTFRDALYSRRIELVRLFLPPGFREKAISMLDREQTEKAQHEAHMSAIKLSELLITYPRTGALQWAPEMHLSDGRKLHITLVNTGEFTSLSQLLADKRRADRIEVSIRGEKGDQFGYSVLWHISRAPRIGDFREYSKGMQISAVFDSPRNIDSEGYAAYIRHEAVDFHQIRQRNVYMRCKEIFDTAINSLTAQQSAKHLP